MPSSEIDHPIQDAPPQKSVGEKACLFTADDFEQAILQCNFNKGIGPDGFNGKILLYNQELRKMVSDEISQYLNTGVFPKYLCEERLVPISKRKGDDVVGLNE